MKIALGEKEEKQLITGLYNVADVYCKSCGEVLGWKYIRAYDAANRFKEGKFIIEQMKVAKEY